MTRPEFSPNVHDINSDSRMAQIGLWVGEHIVGTAIDVVQVLTGHESTMTPGERGDRAIQNALAVQGVLAIKNRIRL